ncbi:MAG: MoaD/ThiS family protein [Firmicutes bacterium]|nr:MoaD/ThiS family protein [Bacillota bacterium]
MEEQITIKVRAFPIIGKTVICDFHLPKGADIRELLERLKTSRLGMEGEPLSQYFFVVNGTIIPVPSAERTLLHDGDEVSIVPMLGGG